jgi:hypothetical protein
MAFLHGEPQKIEVGKAKVEESTREKLATFSAKVEKKKHVKYWTNPDDLSGKVALSFANFRQTYPAVGWVRGDVQTSTEALGELNELRKQLEGAEQRLAAAQTGPPPGTDRLSQRDDDVSFDLVAETTATTLLQYGINVSVPIEYVVSWDAIFSTVGPLLLDEAGQSAIQKRIDAGCLERYGAHVRREARKVIKKDSNENVEFPQHDGPPHR